MRYSTMLRYIEAAMECELASRARRPALVRADEVAALGELAFSGSKRSEEIQMTVDRIVIMAASDAQGLQRSSDPAMDPVATGTLEPAVAKAMVNYASARAAVIMSRDAKVRAANTNGNGTEPAARSAEHRHGIAVTEYCGVWEPETTYGAGAMVTDRGQLWFAQAESTTGRPGTSPDWKMMHKSLEKGGR